MCRARKSDLILRRLGAVLILMAGLGSSPVRASVEWPVHAASHAHCMTVACPGPRDEATHHGAAAEICASHCLATSILPASVPLGAKRGRAMPAPSTAARLFGAVLPVVLGPPRA